MGTVSLSLIPQHQPSAWLQNECTNEAYYVRHYTEEALQQWFSVISFKAKYEYMLFMPAETESLALIGYFTSFKFSFSERRIKHEFPFLYQDFALSLAS